ncbi:MAG: nucleoside 2-deoxyribosyltransferase [Lachnospiraceae bacterium]|nr:nucleoside 2-deoxyribosyltransferase [Lachnospiraceae bacterium]
MAKIYLASPWFKDKERVMYRGILDKMRKEGHEVYAPIEHEVPNAWQISNAEWGRAVFQADVDAIKDCDEVWVLNFGMYSDSGTAWECGFAYGIGKTVRQLVYDIGEDKVFSLMMINGCDEWDSMLNYLANSDKLGVDIEQK